MEEWKLRPGLENTLMRTYHKDLYFTWGGLSLINKFKNDRYLLWIKSSECKIAASNAIQESYKNYRIRKLNKAYQRLSFSKLLLTRNIDYDVLISIINNI